MTPEKLSALAVKSGQPKSSVIRALINGAAIREPPPADYRAMMSELHAIGNNLNQIARVANATGLPDKAAYYVNAAMLSKALLDIRRAVELC